MKIFNEKLIKDWEKLELKAYKPTKNDVWTIGWGHTKDVTPGMTITEAQAQALFQEDIKWVEDFISKNVKVKLSQNQNDALGSWIFNVGVTNAKSSTLLKKLNQGDYEGAAREFPRWNKQKGKVLNGLTKRRAQEMEYFLHSGLSESVGREKPDAASQLKPLTRSKEAVGGASMALLGFLAPLLAENKEGLLWGLSGALAAFGILFFVNRLRSRMKGER